MASAPLGSVRAGGSLLTSSDGRGTAPGGPAALSLFGLECSLGTTSIDALEAIARETTTESLAARFARSPGLEELALVTTCHRVEILGLARDAGEAERWRASLPLGGTAWTLREGAEVVEHVFSVATGRESLAVGEAEVRGQVRLAAGRVLSRHPRPILRAILSAATAAADQLYPKSRATRSIASVAAVHLRSWLDRPRPHVVVVGAGVVGREVARSVAPYARVTIVYHRRPPSDPFLRAIGAEAVDGRRLEEAARSADAIVTAAKFGDRGVRASHIPTDRPVVLIDLGMPRNIDPAVRALPNVRLVDLKELHDLERPAPGRAPPDASLDDHVQRCTDRIQGMLAEPWVATLYRSAEATRLSELATARRYLGELTPAQEAAVDRLTRRLVARLLGPAASRMRSLPPGAASERLRRFTVELFSSSPSDP